MKNQLMNTCGLTQADISHLSEFCFDITSACLEERKKTYVGCPETQSGAWNVRLGMDGFNVRGKLGKDGQTLMEFILVREAGTAATAAARKQLEWQLAMYVKTVGSPAVFTLIEAPGIAVLTHPGLQQVTPEEAATVEFFRESFTRAFCGLRAEDISWSQRN